MSNIDSLNARQKAFIKEYIKDHNGTQAAIRAGYSPRSANSQITRLLADERIMEEIQRLEREDTAQVIATAQDVMSFFTRAMNGEIKDQFGLEATLSDRIKAGQELAKRTVDMENRLAGHADAKVEIKLDWAE